MGKHHVLAAHAPQININYEPNVWWLAWCGVVWCGVVWCGVVWCGVVWCGVVWCGVVKVVLPTGKGRDVFHTGKCTTGGP